LKPKIDRFPPPGSDAQDTKLQLRETDDSNEAAKELSKLTANFTAALNRLLPIAERASRRGKHSLLRLISRKLPRLKIVAEDTQDDDQPVDIIWDDYQYWKDTFGSKTPTEADGLRERIANEAKYGDTSALRTLITSMKELDPTYQPPPMQPAREDTTQTPAKTQAKTKVSQDPDKPTPAPAISPRFTSGAPRSQNEEPWPGHANFPRPKRAPMRRR